MTFAALRERLASDWGLADVRLSDRDLPLPADHNAEHVRVAFGGSGGVGGVEVQGFVEKGARAPVDWVLGDGLDTLLEGGGLLMGLASVVSLLQTALLAGWC